MFFFLVNHAPDSYQIKCVNLATTLNDFPAEAGEGPGLELADVVEGDVEEVEVADGGEGVLVHLGDAVVADVQVPQVAHVGQDLLRDHSHTTSTQT